VLGTGTASGERTLKVYFPGAVFEGNVLTGSPASAKSYPSGNYFPPSFEAVGFADLTHGDYRLSSLSQFRRASPGGLDIGVDMLAIEQAMGLPSASHW
jgi:hypothetical protein